MTEPPFDFYEVVTIFPVDLETEPEVVHLTGKRGVITGMAANEETGEWGFSVAVQSGENWYFLENELKSTGIKVSTETLYGTGASASVRVRVDPETGEGSVIAGDPSMLQRLTPLQINLEELKD